MAEFTDRIKLIYDVVSDNAQSSLSGVKDKVGEADGAFGKLKAGASGVFDTIQQNAGLAMAGAGTAIAGFVAKSIASFDELALSAEQFSTASGTSVEDASRWLEVADDLGVSADTVSGAMNRLNREAASGKLAGFGIDAQNANDRLIDTLTYIASIPDEADRSNAAFQLFGKQGVSALGPLLSNVDDLKARLADVKAGKIISDEDVAQAKAMRDTMDNLSDDWEALSNNLARAFGPTVEKLANLVGKIADVATPTGGGGFWDDVKSGFLSGGLNVVNSAIDAFGGSSDKAKGKQDDLSASVDAANQALQEQEKAAAEADKALQGLLNATLSMFSSQLGLADAGTKASDAIAAYGKASEAAAASGYTNQDAVTKSSDAMAAAEKAALAQAAAASKLASDTATANGATYTAADAARTQASVLETLAGTLDANDPLRANLLAYAGQLERIPAAKNTEITADTSQAENAIRNLTNNFLNALPKFLNIHVGATTSMAPAASSTPTARGVGATNVVALPTATVAPAAYAPAGLGAFYHVEVNVPPLTPLPEVGRYVADALDAHERRVGTRRRLTG